MSEKKLPEKISSPFTVPTTIRPHVPLPNSNEPNPKDHGQREKEIK